MTARLSNELLVIILQDVYNESNVDLSSALRVSRLWRDMAQSVRWRHIYLDHENSKKFLQTIDAMPKHQTNPLDLIISITIQRTKIGRRRLRGHQIIPWLAKVISRMTKLQSISLENFAYLRTSVTDGNLELRSKIFSLLNAIGFCSKIENLEIGGVRVFGEATNNDNHLCKGIAKILPQLVRIHIHKSTFCSAIFTQLENVCPKLEEVILDTVGDCLSADCTTTPTLLQQTRCETAMMTLIDEIRNKSELMPKLEYFAILGLRIHTRDPLNVHSANNVVGTHVHSDSVTFSCRYKIDMLRNETTVWPTCSREPDDSQGDPRTRMPSELAGGVWLRFLNPSGGHLDLFAPEQYCLDRVVEWRIWQETVTGCRLPHGLVQQFDRLLLDMWSPHFFVLSMAFMDFQFHFGFLQRMPIRPWYWEWDKNCVLLDVRVDQDAHLPALPVRRRHDDEKTSSVNSPEGMNLLRMRF